MTDKEKIKAEIERLKKEKEHCPFPEDDYTRGGYNGYYLALDKVLLFLCDLPEEPVSEDLMDATNNYCVNVRKGYPRVKDETDRYICNAFKGGAQWQKEQDKETIELAEDHAMLAGMEKMKEEMMAKAKSGTVQKDNQVILDNGTYIDLDPSMQLKPSFVGLKEGDRIKVIVIKED